MKTKREHFVGVVHLAQNAHVEDVTNDEDAAMRRLDEMISAARAWRAELAERWKDKQRIATERRLAEFRALVPPGERERTKT